MAKRALAGIKVVELGEHVSAPYCAKLMADLGAEVIKVEPPGGDPSRRHGPFPPGAPHPEQSGLYLYLNANKLGVVLDVTDPSERQAFYQMLHTADVLVENHRPDWMRQQRLDYETLRAVNPRLVMTSITAFGQTGPYSNYKAYHLNAAASGGGCLIGSPEREPLAFPLQQGSYQAGVHAAYAALAALFAREATGRGQHVDVAEADVWATFHEGRSIQGYLFYGISMKRSGKRSPGFYPYGIFPCKDGHIYEIAVRAAHWKAFLEVMGNGRVPDWYASDPRFKDLREMGRKYADVLDRLQKPWLMAHTKEEIFQLSQQHRIPFMPVYTAEEVLRHPHLRARKYFQAMSHPVAGRLEYPGPPYRFTETPWSGGQPAPRLGEHTHPVLESLASPGRPALRDRHRAAVV